jgi:hypothetical protein
MGASAKKFGEYAQVLQQKLSFGHCKGKYYKRERE